jgi:hypothetical protein
MQKYRIVPLASVEAERYRRGRGDYYGNPGDIMLSDGAFPCRHCLTDLPEGAPALLVAHRPFASDAPFSEVGPIFVCPDGCDAYARASALPEVIRRRRVVVRAYDASDRIRYGHHELVDGEQAEGAIHRLLADPATAYLHIRSALTGCYHCRVERG